MYKYLCISMRVCLLSSMLATQCAPDKGTDPVDTPLGQPDKKQENKKETTGGGTGTPEPAQENQFEQAKKAIAGFKKVYPRNQKPLEDLWCDVSRTFHKPEGPFHRDSKSPSKDERIAAAEMIARLAPLTDAFAEGNVDTTNVEEKINKLQTKLTKPSDIENKVRTLLDILDVGKNGKKRYVFGTSKKDKGNPLAFQINDESASLLRQHLEALRELAAIPE